MIKYKIEDYIGKKFNKITIIKEVEKSLDRRRFVLVKCDCGNEYKTPFLAVIQCKYKACKKCINKNRGRHNMSRTRLYRIWVDMNSRCYNKNHIKFYIWGGKGVTVCEEWKNDFVPFMEWALQNEYNDNLTIDRINPSKNYEPSNCRFIKNTDQNYHLSRLSNNKSGYKGISWSKHEKKWLVVISINNHAKRIGSFKTVKEACEARNKFIDDNKLLHQKVEYKGEANPY